MLSVVVLRGFKFLGRETYRRGVEDVTIAFPKAHLEPLVIHFLPYAQFPQSPEVHEMLPENRTGLPGLVLAGEYTEGPSVEGSVFSGEKAAEEVMHAC